jgi:hypothetical protein
MAVVVVEIVDSVSGSSASGWCSFPRYASRSLRTTTSHHLSIKVVYMWFSHFVDIV